MGRLKTKRTKKVQAPTTQPVVPEGVQTVQRPEYRCSQGHQWVEGAMFISVTNQGREFKSNPICLECLGRHLGRFFPTVQINKPAE